MTAPASPARRRVLLRPMYSLALVLAALALPAPLARAEVPAPQQISYVSGGKRVTVEHFVGKGKGRRPAVLLLHGSDGLGETRGARYRAAARQLAGRGYSVLLVHYFDRTGTTSADLPTIRRNFFTWIQTVHDGIAFAARLPDVDPARVGLVGYSLGGYLSLSAAALAWKAEHRVAAIVEFFGGLPRLLAWSAKRIPPTLVLHGEKDPIVPVKEARDLERVLKDAGVPYQVRIYPGQGHGFTGEVAREATELAYRFLDRHLRRVKKQGARR